MITCKEANELAMRKLGVQEALDSVDKIIRHEAELGRTRVTISFKKDLDIDSTSEAQEVLRLRLRELGFECSYGHDSKALIISWR